MKFTKQQFNAQYHSYFCLFKLKSCDGIQWQDVLTLVMTAGLPKYKIYKGEVVPGGGGN
jgi:hypothetical protein